MRNEARTERRLEVLKAVVRAFIALGEPVGSKAVAGSAGCEVSPATIRNVMAELEELGYLSQPHASAGRVPTEQGYRIYVDVLLRERRDSVEGESVPGFSASLLNGGDRLPEVLLATSRALSRLCHCVGLVLPPRVSQTRFQHAKFLRLDGSRVVAVVVGEEGVVADRVVRVDTDFPQDELDRISNYIVNRFRGSTLADVRQVLEAELREDAEACDRALRQWLSLTLSCLERSAEAGAVYVEGAAEYVATPDFADLPGVRNLLRAYEEKGRMASLLESCLEREGVQIQIGSESGSGEGLEGLPGLVLVAAQYRGAAGPLGTVGVLGPTRMEYERVIAVVDRVARDLGEALAAGYPSAH